MTTVVGKIPSIFVAKKTVRNLDKKMVGILREIFLRVGPMAPTWSFSRSPPGPKAPRGFTRSPRLQLPWCSHTPTVPPSGGEDRQKKNEHSALWIFSSRALEKDANTNTNTNTNTNALRCDQVVLVQWDGMRHSRVLAPPARGIITPSARRSEKIQIL